MWPLFAISWLFICQISFLFHNYWSETHKFIHEKALWKIVKKIYYKVHKTALWFLIPSFRFIVHITYLTILNKVTEIENNKNLRKIFFFSFYATCLKRLPAIRKQCSFGSSGRKKFTFSNILCEIVCTNFSQAKQKKYWDGLHVILKAGKTHASNFSFFINIRTFSLYY